MKETPGWDTGLRSTLPPSEMTEITSLDEIPEFDDPESEVRFWKTHRLSQELLDQIPNVEELEE